MWQEAHALAPGDLVRARGDRWRVTAAVPGRGCTVLRLTGAGTDNRGSARILLSPFDRPARLEARTRARLVSRPAWMRALARVVVSAPRYGELRAAAFAKIDLLPFQLEPAIAAVRGEASRLLLADEVGLGKTIQAATLLLELRMRGDLAHALILTPAGLREQWAGELAARFGIEAEIVDAGFLRRSALCWPADVNPWSVPSVVIASIDFVKRAEVVRALESLTWDLLVVDEAHAAAGPSDRRDAVGAIASRARRVALLTATPHAGDEAAFDSLCSIGRLDENDRLLVFRRSRSAAGYPVSRRVTLFRVRRSPAERQVDVLLGAYCRRACQRAGETPAHNARLLVEVLQKRAFSSAASLAESVARRLAFLAHTALESCATGDPSAQLDLPFLPVDTGEADDDAAPESVLGVAAFDDIARERSDLDEIDRVARRAAEAESKIAFLRRMLRRVREPAIVFTEYRDTAVRVAEAMTPFGPVVLLHGGLDRAARRDAERRFRSGGARLLVATDAAGSGLNLHDRCRLVINLELPWNPMRLEQRIGRVDRIGQRAGVHAVHLLAGGTSEERVLGRLIGRLERARAAVGHVADPLGVPAPDAVATAVMTGIELTAPVAPAASAPGAVQRTPFVAESPDLRGDAAREADALTLRRFLARGCGIPRVTTFRKPRAAWDVGALLDWPTGAEPRGPSLLALEKRRRARLAAALSRMASSVTPHLVVVMRARLVDGAGRVLEEVILPLGVEIDWRRAASSVSGRASPRIRSPAAVAQTADSLVASVLTLARPGLDAAIATRLDAVRSALGRVVSERHRREEAILREVDRQHGSLARGLLQPNLFDRRSIREAERRNAVYARTREDLERRLADLAAAADATVAGPPDCALVLLMAPDA